LEPPALISARVAAISAPTSDVRVLSLVFELDSGFTFRPGQYVRLGFADFPPCDYSIANHPGESHLEFHISVRSSGTVSEYLRTLLALGDAVSIDGPFGDAYLRPEHLGPILAIAGGTGLVPAKSIIGAALKLENGLPIYFYLGARTDDDLYAEPLFLDWQAAHSNFTFVPVLSEPESGSTRRLGNVTDAVADDFPDMTGFKCYVAGPPPMVAAAIKVTAAVGVARHDIHADPFLSEEHHSASAST
jgi:ferredoxin-NAD(P)+ reductase (naphthalene dioxygenase ferredoxin-specific)